MIRFSKYIWVYVLLSSLVIIPGIISLVLFGLKPSIDFTGGTVMEIQFAASIDREILVEAAAARSIPISSISQTKASTYVIKTKPMTDATMTMYQEDIEKKTNQKPDVLRRELVGPILGSELLVKAIVASGCAVIAILLYVAYAFRNVKFGVSAILALAHDVLVVFGCFSILGKLFHVEVDTLFVTAFLTTMSFSVHDTIVIFDRIREYRKRDQKTSLTEVSDMALTETMGRSLVNSFTIIFMLFALVLMGGDSVQWFALALLIGTITGTYSSPFVATPILLFWDRWERRRIK